MTNLVPVEFQGERIITTEQLAQIYETESRRISENFNRNAEKFVEGKHYFKLEGEELKVFKSHYANCVSPYVSNAYLWTKQGASRHCKMLGTDKAWEQFDILEESYFNPPAMTQMEMIAGIATACVAHEKSLKRIESRQDQQDEQMQSIRDIVVVQPDQKRQWIKSTINKIVVARGGHNDLYGRVRTESYYLLNARLGVNVYTRESNRFSKTGRKVNTIDIILV